MLVYLLARMAATYTPRKTFADFDEMLTGPVTGRIKRSGPRPQAFPSDHGLHKACLCR
jgi:hypothetical protein